MDKLKAELARKRKAAAEEFGGKKFVKRSEIEAHRLQEIKKKEQEIQQTKAANAVERGANGHHSDSDKEKDPDAGKRHAGKASTILDKQGNAALELSDADVMKRLRALGEPIRLFGEEPDDRRARLEAVARARAVQQEQGLLRGVQNDFLRDITEQKAKEKHQVHQQRRTFIPNLEAEVKEQTDGTLVRVRESGAETSDGDRADGENGERAGGLSGLDSGEEAGRLVKRSVMAADAGDALDQLELEKKVMVFFRRLLAEWEEDLEARPEAEKRTAPGRAAMATQLQCARYLKPLFRLCKRKQVPPDLLMGLDKIIGMMRGRDYLAAADMYVRIAIGNSPWPIGVTMVGIHERSAREKIHATQVAHVMNDETTRKYLQSVKRLMTFCQGKYPADPSRSIEYGAVRPARLT